MTTTSRVKTRPSPLAPLETKAQRSSKALNTRLSKLKGANDIFADITVVKPLNKAKFSVYQIRTKVSKQNYAMKVFEHSKRKPNMQFQNEVRFSFVNHPNIIRTHHIEYERESISQGRVKKVSYIVMEYAPYGDFFSFILKQSRDIDDKLIRTYFRQLMEGIEYLHDHGVSHMDLKPENLLLGEDFKLKVTDFDLSYFDGDRIVSKGTKCFRAPEVIQGRCKNAPAADIYSAGVILFTFRSRGIVPHAEDSSVDGVDFAGIMYDRNEEFWDKHCEIQNKSPTFFDEDFKNLFNAMTELDPSKRATISQIKQSNWYNGPIYTDEEVKAKVGKLF